MNNEVIVTPYDPPLCNLITIRLQQGSTLVYVKLSWDLTDTLRIPSISLSKLTSSLLLGGTQAISRGYGAALTYMQLKTWMGF